MAQTPYTYLPPETLDKLDKLDLTSRYLAEGAILGLHRSPYRGFSSEFSEYRKYSAGDSIKFLDWKVFARSDKYFVKCFEEETNLRCFILLDKSGSMGMASPFDRTASPAKFNFACRFAAAFLYLCRKQRDAASLCAWSDHVELFTECSNAPGGLVENLRRLEAMTPGGGTDSGAVLHEAAGRIPRRSLVLIFSDFLEAGHPYFAPLRELCFKDCEIVLFQVLNEAEQRFPYTGPVRFRDMETNRTMELEAEACRAYYRESFRAFQAELELFCGKQKIVLQSLTTADPFEKALSAYFAKRENLH